MVQSCSTRIMASTRSRSSSSSSSMGMQGRIGECGGIASEEPHGQPVQMLWENPPHKLAMQPPREDMRCVRQGGTLASSMPTCECGNDASAAGYTSSNICQCSSRCNVSALQRHRSGTQGTVDLPQMPRSVHGPQAAEMREVSRNTYGSPKARPLNPTQTP